MILISFYFLELKPQDKVILYIVNFTLCFIIYTIIYFHNKNKPTINLSEILLIAVIFRIILLFVNPITSDDYYRYLWDGKVQYAGIDPYEYTPAELTSLHDKILYPSGSYPDIITIYPPLAQILFFISYTFFGPYAWGLKIIYIFLETGIIIFLFNTLNILRVNTNHILLYVLSPLIIFEIFINAHIDILLIFFLIGSINFALKNKSMLSLAFLGMSVMSKSFSLILLPLFLLYFYNNNKNLKRSLLNVVCFLIPFSIILPYYQGFMNIFPVMESYMKDWYFNSLPFRGILALTKIFGLSDQSYTRIILLLMFLISYLYVIFLKTDLINKSMFIVFFYFLFSHTVNPWYLTSLVLFLPAVLSNAIFFWSGIICFTNITLYYYLKDKVWQDIIPVLIIEYTVLVFLFYYELKKNRVNLISESEVTL